MASSPTPQVHCAAPRQMINWVTNQGSDYVEKLLPDGIQPNAAGKPCCSQASD